MKYDYLIIGSGLYGACFANLAARKGKTSLVVEKNNFVGGSLHCVDMNGIIVHEHGPHIFHTNSKEAWDYVNEFVEFAPFVNSPIANFNGELYNLPFNMNTFHQLWGVKTPQEALSKIEEQRKEYSHIVDPQNLEEQALVLAGKDIYEKLIKGYTEKQWGRSAKELPASVIKRLPFRFTFDNNYFNDKYQGIPIGGYNSLIEKMIFTKGIDIVVGVDYFERFNHFNSLAKTVVYTGPIDKFFGYKYGRLQYRSLRFEHELYDTENYQGNAVVNYTDAETPFTRIIEHKHFAKTESLKTIVTREYPIECGPNDYPYYPIGGERNNPIFGKYKAMADKLNSFHFGGRLAEYKYYNMNDIIEKLLDLWREE